VSKSKRRAKAQRRVAAARNQFPGLRDLFGGKCWNGCGERGPHFVPPSLGQPGFYICTPKERNDQAE
jgi:hypothetical protein